MQKYAVLTMGKGTNYPDIFIMPMENWLLARIPIAPALNMNMIRGESDRGMLYWSRWQNDVPQRSGVCNVSFQI